MRKLRIAEWILALSMPRERAEAVAGDLSESGRGAFWFWRSVVATMVASVWSDFRAVWWWLLAIAFVFGLANVISELVILEGVIGRYPVPTYERIGVVLNVVSAPLFSRWLAQFSRGRELASWLASQILVTAVGLLLVLIVWRGSFYLSFVSWYAFLSLVGAMSALVRPRLLVRHA